MITKIIYLEGDDGVSPFEEFDDLQKFGHVTAADIFSAHLVITDAGRILKDSRDHKTIVNSLELVKKKKGRSKYRSIYGDEEIKPIKFLEEIVPEKLQKPIFLSMIVKFLPVDWDSLNIGDTVYYKIRSDNDNAHGPFTVIDKTNLLIVSESNVKIKVTENLDLLKPDMVG